MTISDAVSTKPQVTASSQTIPAAKRILLSGPDVGELEEEYLLRAFRSGWIAPSARPEALRRNWQTGWESHTRSDFRLARRPCISVCWASE